MLRQNLKVWSYGENPTKTPRMAQNKKFTRDTINARMEDRDMFVQIGGNQFHSNNNYVNDIANRDKYLLARDSKYSSQAY